VVKTGQKKRGRRRQVEADFDASKPLGNARWEAFAQDCVTLTQVEAYRKQYPSARRWKPQIVAQRASELARKIQVRISNLKNRTAEAVGISREEWLREVLEIARVDLPGIASMKKNLLSVKDFDALTPAQRAAIKKINVVTVGMKKDGRPIERVTVQIHDKLEAYNMIGRAIGAYDREMRKMLGDFLFQFIGEGKEG
jgi:hypothetical protein